MSIDQKELDELLKGHEAGTLKRGRNERLAIGKYKITAVELKKKAEVTKMNTPDGKTVEVEALNAYVLVLKVAESSNPTQAVGSRADVYLRMNATEAWARDADKADLITMIATLMTTTGADGKSAPPAAGDVRDVLKDGKQIAGFSAYVNVRPSDKHKDDPKAFLFHNWSPCTQTIEDVQRERAALEPAAK